MAVFKTNQMKTIFQVIERALIVEMNISFNNAVGNNYEIKVRDADGNERYVHLPIGDHLNEAKMVKYAEMLIDDLLTINKHQTESSYRQEQIEFYKRHLELLEKSKHKLETTFYFSELEAVQNKINKLMEIPVESNDFVCKAGNFKCASEKECMGYCKEFKFPISKEENGIINGFKEMLDYFEEPE